jgi:hypothetical protein
MRLHATLLLIGLLALRALPTDAQGRYIVLGIGGDSCGRSVSQHGAELDVPYPMGLAALVRITCNLDGAMLWIENYRQDSENNLTATLRPTRQKTKSGR